MSSDTITGITESTKLAIDLLKAEYLSLLDKRHTLILAVFTTISASLFSAIMPFMDLFGNNTVTVFLKGILAPWTFFLMLAIYFLSEMTRMEVRLFSIEKQLNNMLDCSDAFNAFSRFSNPLAVNFKVVLLPTVSFAAALFISMYWEESQLSRFCAFSIVCIAYLLIPYVENKLASKESAR